MPTTRGNATCLCHFRNCAESKFVLPMSWGIEVYDRDGLGLVDPGLSIDHSPWHFNVFALRDR